MTGGPAKKLLVRNDFDLHEFLVSDSGAAMASGTLLGGRDDG
jgi:hypothetical protein